MAGDLRQAFDVYGTGHLIGRSLSLLLQLAQVAALLDGLTTE
jgi:hypothetical protein